MTRSSELEALAVRDNAETHWTVRHPVNGWGLESPHLYPSRGAAIEHLQANGLWPLLQGWKLIAVEVRARATGAA